MKEVREILVDRATRVFESIDEVATNVLKGHLVIEELLEEIIHSSVRHPEYLKNARLSFSQKSQIARSLANFEHSSNVWLLIEKINKLRNQLAHSLDPKKRSERLKDFLEACRIEMQQTGMQDDFKTKADHLLVILTSSYVVGFLGFMNDGIKKRENLRTDN